MLCSRTVKGVAFRSGIRGTSTCRLQYEVSVLEMLVTGGESNELE
jgi:hypothetical protein